MKSIDFMFRNCNALVRERVGHYPVVVKFSIDQRPGSYVVDFMSARLWLIKQFGLGYDWHLNENKNALWTFWVYEHYCYFAFLDQVTAVSFKLACL